MRERPIVKRKNISGEVNITSCNANIYTNKTGGLFVYLFGYGRPNRKGLTG